MSEPIGSATPQVVVPKFNHNPVASLRRWGHQLQFQGEHFWVPPLSAADWLSVLMNPDSKLTDVVPGFLDEEDRGRFMTLWLHSDADLDDVFEQLLEAASGRRWWVTMRLIGVMAGAWNNLGAQLILDGIDAERLSLAAWLDVATIKMLQVGKPEETNLLMMQIEMPPEGTELPEEEMAMSADEFLSLG